jgi:hypothetical protein
MICNPRDCSKIINTSLPNFRLASYLLQIVSQFDYLELMMTDDLSSEISECDLQHEIR